MLGMWAAFPPKWKKVPDSLFHQLQEMEKKMKIYKAIHGDNLRRFKKQRDFLSQHSFDFNIVNPTIRILLLSTVYQLSAFERES